MALVVEGQLYLPSVRRLPTGCQLAAAYLAELLTAKGEASLSASEAVALFQAACCSTDTDADAKVTLMIVQVPKSRPLLSNCHAVTIRL